MPIEFRCPGCGKLLRTADETAGKQAKCPQCGAVMTIPAMGSMGPAPQSPAGPANYPDPNQASQSILGTSGGRGVSASSPAWRLATSSAAPGRFLRARWAYALRSSWWSGSSSVANQFLGATTKAIRILKATCRRDGGRRRRICAHGAQRLPSNGYVSDPFEDRHADSPTSSPSYSPAGRNCSRSSARHPRRVVDFSWASLFCVIPGIIFALMFSQVPYLVLDREHVQCSMPLVCREN